MASQLAESVWEQLAAERSSAVCSADERPAGALQAPIVLMVSGGSDSTAMCLVAHELVQEGALDAATISVLHVNHNLRGEDSQGDAAFVERLAGLCALGFELRSIDVFSTMEEYGGNMENAARHMRYELAGELLDGLCRRAGVPKETGRIWTAHTQDDRVETFFMRAIVGTGPGGFCTIRRRSGRVVRPLLDADREQLRGYIAARVAELGWQLDDAAHAQTADGLWREDATNYDTAGFRSFVRHELVPVAERRNPSLGKTLSRTIDLLTDENDAVEAMVGRVARRAVRILDDGRISLDIDEASCLERPFLRRLVYSTCRDAIPESERIELRHIDLIMNSLDASGLGATTTGSSEPHAPTADVPGSDMPVGRPAGKPFFGRGFSMDLPGGVHVRREGSCLVFGNVPAHTGSPVRAGLTVAASLTDAAVPAGPTDAAGPANPTGSNCSADYVELPVPGSALCSMMGDDVVVKATVVDAGMTGDEHFGCESQFARTHATPMRVFVDRDKLLAACASSEDAEGAVREVACAEPRDAACALQQEAEREPSLLVTRRRNGDVVCPFGMNGAHKKLSDVLVDKKVERRLRDELLVLRAGDAIAWVPGVVADERFGVSDGSRMICLEVEPNSIY